MAFLDPNNTLGPSVGNSVVARHIAVRTSILLDLAQGEQLKLIEHHSIIDEQMRSNDWLAGTIVTKLCNAIEIGDPTSRYDRYIRVMNKLGHVRSIRCIHLSHPATEVFDQL